ncbi:MAG: flagellar protein FlaG [Candidatus Abyssobacteria bacterium SURF_5]|uniref:Flagellar protein FlaG n=1 Tax=Abyssobacteria bacterium (strain SURF_5) TaxID=2093360 RepID=A0A3A4NK54_ABYX5|nr:MAG: flagellar protein FlaG [Candidatus Abyssubacteria bacterium SURF_5]
MGIRIDQAGYPGLDPAAGTTSGVSIDRRVGSSPPATPQFASVESQTFAAADAAELDAAEMKSTLDGVNKFLSEIGSSLNFIHDEASGRSAVQVLDEHGEVIRQIPPQELLDVYAKIRNIVGILLDESG